MTACVLVLFVILSVHSLITYKKIYQRWSDNLQTFADNLHNDISQEKTIVNSDIAKRMEMLIRKDRDQKLQIKLEDEKNGIIYINEGYKGACDSSFWKFKDEITICAHAVGSNSSLHVDVARNIRSYPSFYTYNNIPFLVLVMISFVLMMLVLIRYLLRIELVGPLNQLIKNLEDDQSFNDRGHEKRSHEWNVLSQAIRDYKDKIVKYTTEQNDFKVHLEKETVRSEIMAQLAHDIRSPLAALDMIASNIPELDEEKRVLVRKATSRIHSIANNLMSRDVNRKSELNLQMLPSIIHSMVSEKKEQYQSNDKIVINEYIDPRAYGIFARIEIDDFKRMLSNVIDNAVQAIPSVGFVRVSLTQRDEAIIVEIFDNGKGIPSEVIDKVTSKSFSYNKVGGTGLGLYIVDQKIKEWGGKLEIQSELNVGTTVRLFLKKEQPPVWFVSKIEIKDDEQYVVLDDDHTIHDVWKTRILKSTGKDVRMFHFENETDFENWFLQAKPDQNKTNYFFDYELIGNRRSGLDIIETHGLAASSILVTSHYENEDIQKRCLKNGVRMIPKELAGFVPIIAD